MEQKTKVIILVALIIIITVFTFAFFKMKKGSNTEMTTTKNEVNQTIEKTNKQDIEDSKTEETKLGDTTLEGVVISLDGKNIAISNNTPEPTLFGINGSTPVVKLDKDGKETVSGLAQIKSGEKAKVLYDSNDKTKQAKKIYLLGQ